MINQEPRSLSHGIAFPGKIPESMDNWHRPARNHCTHCSPFCSRHSSFWCMSGYGVQFHMPIRKRDRPALYCTLRKDCNSQKSSFYRATLRGGTYNGTSACHTGYPGAYGVLVRQGKSWQHAPSARCGQWRPGCVSHSPQPGYLGRGNYCLL
jgi:hypothetical protein